MSSPEIRFSLPGSHESPSKACDLLNNLVGLNDPQDASPELLQASLDVNPPSYSGKQFWWWRDLSPNAQKLYKLLIIEAGDKNLLPTYATEGEFDLNDALNELREFDVLEDSNPNVYKLK